MADLLYTHGVRPSVRFHHARRTQRSGTAQLGKVCIIGAFPTVSETLLRFKDLQSAREALNITPDKNDLKMIRSTPDSDLVANPNYYVGAGALRWAFLQGTNIAGASEVLVCNITTHELTVEEDANENQIIQEHCENGVHFYNTTLTHEVLLQGTGNDVQEHPLDKLDIALSKLKGEEFDSLIFAYDLNANTHEATGTYDEDGRDEGLVTILEKLKQFTHDNYTVKNPFGLYLGLDIPPSDTESAVTVAPATVGGSVVDSVVDTNRSKVIDRKLAEKYADIFSDPIHNAHSLYAMVCMGIKTSLRDYTLSTVETAAYLCGVESGLPVDTIMGQRELPYVTGVEEELNYDPYYKDANDVQNDGIYLLASGITCFECINRTNNTWAIVNSEQPCGYDISHLRTSAFIIKQIALTPFLCNLNYDVTRESVDSVIASIKDKYVERFPGVISIEHHIEEKRNPKCIEIYLYINFYGIIIDEIVYVAMGVEDDE